MGATAQGKHPGVSSWELGVAAFDTAVTDAGLDKGMLDGLVTQEMQDGSGGMELTRFGQIIGLNPRASGSLQYGTSGFSLALAIGMLASGQASAVACCYATNQKTAGYRFRRPLRPEWERFGAYNPATMSALGFNRYLHDTGADASLLGHYAIQMRANAARNPLAYRRSPLTMDDYRSARVITEPLTVLDIASITDGGAALIVANEEVASQCRSAVPVLGMARRDPLRMLQNKDHLLTPHLARLGADISESTGIPTSDFDAYYIQDPHSPMVPMTLEALGLVGPGRALSYIADGGILPGGPTPVNPNGGQLSEGYMVGWLHHVDAVRQLRGDAVTTPVKCQKALFCASGGFREYAIAVAYGAP
ncbi:MAG: thiolase family protein [Acidobacteriota bacterium]|nr:thiolase family protein [Acidobacteriota bacterium]